MLNTPILLYHITDVLTCILHVTILGQREEVIPESVVIVIIGRRGHFLWDVGMLLCGAGCGQPGLVLMGVGCCCGLEQHLIKRLWWLCLGYMRLNL